MMEFNAQKIIDDHGGKCNTLSSGQEATLLAVVNGIVIGYVLVNGVPSATEWNSEGESLHAVSHNLIMPRTVVAETYIVFSHIGTGLERITPYENKQVTGSPQAKVTLYSDDKVESEVVE